MNWLHFDIATIARRNWIAESSARHAHGLAADGWKDAALWIILGIIATACLMAY
jgi:hypothetical protein